MGHVLRIRKELADVIRMSNGEAMRAKYLALAEHMDALIEAEAKCLVNVNEKVSHMLTKF